MLEVPGTEFEKPSLVKSLSVMYKIRVTHEIYPIAIFKVFIFDTMCRCIL